MCIYKNSIVMFLVCKLRRAAHIINGMGNNCKSKIMTIDTSSRKLWPHTIAIISTTYIYYNKAVVRYCPFKQREWIPDRMVWNVFVEFNFIYFLIWIQMLSILIYNKEMLKKVIVEHTLLYFWYKDIYQVTYQNIFYV